MKWIIVDVIPHETGIGSNTLYRTARRNSRKYYGYAWNTLTAPTMAQFFSKDCDITSQQRNH